MPEEARAAGRDYALDRAHDLILEGADRFPNDDGVQAVAGDSFVFAKGNSAEARPYWEKALALNPNHVQLVEIYLQRAFAHSHLGHFEQARQDRPR